MLNTPSSELYTDGIGIYEEITVFHLRDLDSKKEKLYKEEIIHT